MARVRPALQQHGIKLVFVTCGNTHMVDAWKESSGYPVEEVYLDQKGVLYNKTLNTKKGLARTLFRPDMWILGALKRLRWRSWSIMWRSLRHYKLTVPQAKWQSWQQGGTFIYRGRRLLWSHYDATPGDYPSWNKVIREAVAAAAGRGAAEEAGQADAAAAGAAAAQGNTAVAAAGSDTRDVSTGKATPGGEAGDPHNTAPVGALQQFSDT